MRGFLGRLRAAEVDAILLEKSERVYAFIGEPADRFVRYQPSHLPFPLVRHVLGRVLDAALALHVGATPGVDDSAAHLARAAALEPVKQQDPQAAFRRFERSGGTGKAEPDNDQVEIAVPRSHGSGVERLTDPAGS